MKYNFILVQSDEIVLSCKPSKSSFVSARTERQRQRYVKPIDKHQLYK